jgi:hypothetical protein
LNSPNNYTISVLEVEYYVFAYLRVLGKVEEVMGKVVIKDA